MKRFKNILLIFDEGVRGEAACSRAATLAKENQAQLNVVEVIGELPADAQRFISVWRPRTRQRISRLVAGSSGQTSEGAGSTSWEV